MTRLCRWESATITTFNSFLGSLPVAAARIEPVPDGYSLILDVPGVS